MAVKWYMGSEGPYGSDGNFGDPQIDARPSVDHVYESNAWRLKNQTELDNETDSVAEAEINNSKLIKAVVSWMANLNGLTPTEAKQQIKAIYRNL